MNKFILTIVSFFLTIIAVASANPKNFHQRVSSSFNINDTIPKKDSLEDFIWSKVEVEASFDGGDPAWIKFLQENLDSEVPIKKKAPDGKYTVWIQFVVAKDGRLSDFVALTNNGYGMEKEVIRVLKKCPRWKPAIQDGRTVKAYRKQPVTFVVTTD